MQYQFTMHVTVECWTLKEKSGSLDIDLCKQVLDDCVIQKRAERRLSFDNFNIIEYPVTLFKIDYRQTSNLSRILVGNKIVDHSNVVGVSPVDAAPTTSSFSI